jgi:hypothetical protein
MQPQPPQKPTSFEKFKTWTNVAVDVILFQKVPRGTNLEKKLTIPNDPTPFKGLLPEVQKIIIGLIISGAQAETLESAARSIDALSLVNKDLNKTFNHPLYCSKIIKSLAKRFDTSDQAVCEYLHIPAAKTIFKNQMQFLMICRNTNIGQADQNQEFINFFMNNPVDLNFTYEPNRGNLIIFAIASNSLNILQLLLQNGADPEQANKKNITPLMWANSYSNQQAIKLIEEAIAKKNEKK